MNLLCVSVNIKQYSEKVASQVVIDKLRNRCLKERQTKTTFVMIFELGTRYTIIVVSCMPQLSLKPILLTSCDTTGKLNYGF